MSRIISALLVTTCLCGLYAASPAIAASEGASTSVASSSSTTVMKIRITPKDITAIQNKLAEKGYYKSKVDGQFGPGTQDAMRDFQSAEGLEANGYPTTATLERLGVTTENKPMMTDNDPPGKGGVVYTQTIERKDVAEKSNKAGFANVDSASQNGGSCLHCTNGPIGNGGTNSMHSNEY
jgi:peptidoglycan hydrolase-like protein with peptidoglycan-binding domain